MVFSYAEQQRLLKQYLGAEVKNLEKAAAIVTKATAQKLGNEIKKQMRSNFRKGKDSQQSRNFPLAVKVYNFNPNGAKGAASYVRLGVPWVHIFEEGGTVGGGGKHLIILLPKGEALNYPRVNLKGWQRIWEMIKDKSVLKPVSDGVLVLLKDGTNLIPIYKFQKVTVRVPKRLSFYQEAERLSEGMDSAIADLIGE
jgi:hypothetical protein